MPSRVEWSRSRIFETMRPGGILRAEGGTTQTQVGFPTKNRGGAGAWGTCTPEIRQDEKKKTVRSNSAKKAEKNNREPYYSYELENGTIMIGSGYDWMERTKNRDETRKLGTKAGRV